jgi:bacteriocin-like protein
MKELSKDELMEVDGGFVFFRWTGWLDGVKGNTDIDFLWWDIV